jgi:hypothetical protein
MVNSALDKRRLQVPLFFWLHSHDDRTVLGEKTDGLFQKTLLCKQNPEVIADHQGQYIIIFITFKNIKSTSFDEAKLKIRSDRCWLVNEW